MTLLVQSKNPITYEKPPRDANSCGQPTVEYSPDVGNETLAVKMDELRSHFDNRFDSLGVEYSSLKEENIQLKKELASAIIHFSQDVEPEFFSWILHILAAGSIRSAATRLGIPQSTLAKKLKTYSQQGTRYKTLYDIIAIRKKAGRNNIERYNELFADHQPAPPERSFVEAILEGLEALSGNNWMSVRNELIELAKDEI